MHAVKDRCIYDEDSVKRVKYVYDHGHQVASHTWAHKDLTTLSWDNSAYRLCITFMTATLMSYFAAVHDEMWRVERKL